MPGLVTLSCDQLQTVVRSTFKSVCGQTKFQYLSGPVTGGDRFLHWQRGVGSSLPEEVWQRERNEAVIRPNCRALTEAARIERDVHKRPTIEPGSFEAGVREWDQADYYALWDQVIADHVDQIRFMDDWASSAGCAYEYYCAMKYGCVCLTMQGDALHRDAALTALDEATRPMEKTDPAIAKLRAKIEALRNAIAGCAYGRTDHAQG